MTTAYKVQVNLKLSSKHYRMSNVNMVKEVNNGRLNVNIMTYSFNNTTDLREVQDLSTEQ